MGTAAVSVRAATVELDDIQGLVKRGYGKLEGACYLLLRFGDPAAARRWVAAVTERVFPADRPDPEDRAVNVAFTHPGLEHLGVTCHLDPDHPFSLEFAGGMTTAHRSRILGDHGTSSPEGWAWGGPGDELHALLLLFARDQEALGALRREEETHLGAHGIDLVAALDACLIPGSVEHFGFRDGVARPVVAGFGSGVPPEREDDARRVFEKGGSHGNILAAGEFVLGYPNVYGKMPSSPRVTVASDAEGHLPGDPEDGNRRDLGRNGSYLVMRQLSQRVHRFWGAVDERTRDGEGGPDPAARERLAAKMVGRWRDGSPLMLCPDAADPEQGTADAFGFFHDDAHGERCPVGSHIRRANPRDGLEPELGKPATATGNAMKHRLLRRGRPYGPVVDPSMSPEAVLRAGPETDETPRGLHFLALNANIGRQFEFVQHTWINNPKFGGLYSETDPIVGAVAEEGTAMGISGDFTVPGTVREKYHGLERFVDVVGGAYFFLPGVRALRYVGALAGDDR